MLDPKANQAFDPGVTDDLDLTYLENVLDIHSLKQENN